MFKQRVSPGKTFNTVWTLERDCANGKETLKTALPVVLTVDLKISEPRVASPEIVAQVQRIAPIFVITVSLPVVY